MPGIDLISDFREIIYSYSDIPLPFVEAGGFSIISTCFGRFYYIPKARGIRPNLFLVLSSAPHIGRRSYIISCVKTVRRSAFKKYLTLLNNNKYDDSVTNRYYSEIKAHILESGSPEGLIDDIEYLKKLEVNSFCLTSPEFGKILTGIIEAKGYQAGFDDLLCRLWSGESAYQSFSHRGGGESRYLSPGTYFNLIGSTQKIHNYIHEKMAETGVLRRFLIASVEGTDMDKWESPLEDHEAMVKELIKLGGKIGNRMFQLHAKAKQTEKFIPLPYDNKVAEEVERYSKVLEMSARADDENPYLLYKVNRWEHALKVAGNIALSKLEEQIKFPYFEQAQIYVDKNSVKIKTILEQLKVPDKQKGQEKNLNAILRYFKLGLSRSDVQKRMSAYGVHAKEYGELIAILLTDGKIKAKDKTHFEVLE